MPFVVSSSVRRKLRHRVKYLRNLRRTRYSPAWRLELGMGRVSAKAQRTRDHNAKMWQKGRQGEKAGNQNHCCDHVAQDHCCGNGRSISPLFEVKSVLLGYVEIQPTLLYAFTRSVFIRCIFVSISPDPHISPVRRGLFPTSPLRGSPEEDHHRCAEGDLVFEKV